MNYQNLLIRQRILLKLKIKHKVVTEELWECFMNRSGGFLEDIRTAHRTEPPTMWFVAETDRGRLLKIVFIELFDGRYEIKTAYEPNDIEVKLYEKFA